MAEFPNCCGITCTSYVHNFSIDDTEDECEYGLCVAELRDPNDVTPEWTLIVGTMCTYYRVNPYVEEPTLDKATKWLEFDQGDRWETHRKSASFIEEIDATPSIINYNQTYMNEVIIMYNFWFDKVNYAPDYKFPRVDKYSVRFRLERVDPDADIKLTLDEIGNQTVLVDLAESQLAVNEAALLANGFKIVTTFINPKHGSLNRLYVRPKQ